MLSWLTGKRDLKRRGEALFAAVSARARRVELFTTCAVPDTVEGRFEMVVLHLVLTLDRLVRLGADGEALARASAEAFVTAMDDTMRAIGVGDLAVPRKVKKAAAALYDRHRTYGAALEGGGMGAAWEAALTEALTAGGARAATDITALATAAMAEHAALAAVPDDHLREGLINA